ncbi:MAG TPA: triple tyrosine motif-containing protein [Thermoleophilaceae bacterium]|nr:triple tyrosine motif-containing protein [Thermoleophilaceae bacterium]
MTSAPARLLVLATCLVGLALPANAAAAPPANDNQANAIVLTGESPPAATGTNVDATAQAGEPGHYFVGNSFGATAEPMHSVWWKWTVPTSGMYTFNTCNSSFDVALAIYVDDGTPSGFMRFNDDACDRQERVSLFQAQGTQLLIAIDGVDGATGAVSLKITKTPPPANDAFANALPLSGPTDSDGVDNSSATAQASEPQHAGQPANASAWWKWTAPSSGPYVIDACEPGAWSDFYSRQIAVYTQGGSGLAGLATLAEDRLSWDCGRDQRTGVVRITAVMNQTYYIAVEGRGFTTGVNTFVNVRPQVAPPNDNFANAATLTGPSAFATADTRDATGEASEPRHVSNGPAAHSVWWKLTVPTTDDYLFTLGADFRAGWNLYRQNGSGFAGLEELLPGSANRFRNPDGTRTHGRDHYIRLSAGTTYYVAIDGAGDGDEDDPTPGGGGHVSLELSLVDAPVNDDFADATLLEGVADSARFLTRGGSVEAGEPNAGARLRTVWYRWTAPSAGDYLVDICVPNPSDPGNLDNAADLGVYEQNGAGFAGLAAVPPKEQQDCRGDFESAPDRHPFTAVTGKTYFFVVDGRDMIVDSGLQIRKLNRPVNDNFAAVRTLTGGTDSDTGTNIDASHEPNEPTLGGDGPGSVWWKWSAPAVGRYVIETCGSDFTTMLRSYTDGNPNPTVAQLDQFNVPVFLSPGCDGGSRLIIDNQTVGRTYYLAVDGLEFPDAGSVEISVRPSAPPANDNLAGAAQLVGMGAQGSASTVEATVEDGEPVHHPNRASNRTVWWKWTAPSTANVVIDACESTYDTVMAVYTGGPGVADLTPVGSNHNGEECSQGSRLTLAATAGTQYLIAIGSASENSGTVGTASLAIVDALAPANDNFANAATVPASGGSFGGDNLFATSEPAEGTFELSGENTVWWKWTPTTTGAWSLVTCSPGNAFEIEPEAFRQTGVGFDGLVRVAADETQCAGGGRADFVAVAGKTYYFRVSGSNEGDFELALRRVERPANDEFADAELLTGQADFAAGSNLDATRQTGEPSHGDVDENGDTNTDGRSVWWRWTVPTGGSGTYGISVDCGSVISTVRAYTGPGLTQLTSRGTPSRENCAGGSIARLTLVATAGQLYFIAVDSSDPGRDGFGLTLQLAGAGGDVTPPETKIDTGPAAGAQLAVRTAKFTYSSNEPGSTFQCRLVGRPAGFAACNSGTITYSNLPDGSYRFEVRASDATGNQDPSAATRTFTVAVGGPPPPPDGDDDGVPDSSDACPTVSDAAAPRNPRTGCPADVVPTDSDGDGVPNGSDACPSVSDAAAPRNPRTGCPADPVTPGDDGTDGDDVLTGDGLPNLICGLGGDDEISGLGGNDTLYGDACGANAGGASVSQVGKDGNDRLLGGDGNDKLFGAGGKDKLLGGKGNDKLKGDAGNDTLKGDAGKDTLDGGKGNDKLTGGGGKNKYKGGPGNDTLKAKNKKKETVNCGPGKKDKAVVDKTDKTKGCETVKRAKQ